MNLNPDLVKQTQEMGYGDMIYHQTFNISFQKKWKPFIITQFKQYWRNTSFLQDKTIPKIRFGLFNNNVGIENFAASTKY